MSDFEKFQIYYEEYIGKVYAYINCRMNYNQQLAEDLTSEIFMKALEKFETFSEKQGSFNAWIFKITKNHMIDYFRSQDKKKSTSIDELENVLQSKEDTAGKAEKNIAVERLREAIDELPEDKQEIVSLKYISGYSYKEIAEMLQEEENAIRVKAHRTIKELKRKLYELDYEQ